MNPGYVYILTNSSMPGLIKVGRTSRDVDLRAAELWQTGVPTKFEIYASEKTCDCVQLEAFAHGDLRKHRLNKSREFFRIEPEEAHERLRFWVEYQASELLKEQFSSAIAAVPFRELVSGVAIDRLAAAHGVSARTISDAMDRITEDEIAPAVQRALADYRQEQFTTFQEIGIPEEEWEGLLNG